MCYSRDSFCVCCKSFIRILTINRCLKEEKCKTIVFPKLLEKCDDCQKCEVKCCVVPIPRSWNQKSTIFVCGFAKENNKLLTFLSEESNGFSMFY